MPGCMYFGVLHSFMSNTKSLLNLDRKIKSLLFYRKNVHRNSTQSKILDMMYSDINLTIKQITSKMDKPHKYTKKIILQMCSDKYMFSDEKKYNKAYHLSQTGRWFALCVKLDYISFQSLCILSQVYCRIKRDPNGDTSCCMISKFRDTFDKSCDVEESCASAVYTSRNISQSIRMLTDRSLIHWINDDFVKINSAMFHYLQKYDEDFASLTSWQNEMFERCKNEQLNVVMNLPEKKKLFALIKSTR